MVELGYWLSSEEHPPKDLVRNAAMAEQEGFTFSVISDHYLPWTNKQGQSPFVWSVIGAIANATSTLRLGTGVTCPTIRIHPAIVAQAAATSAAMMPGRFFLGLGSGENLNEHVVGQGWPPPAVRLDMLTEAVEVIRQLFQGGNQSYDGAFYTVEDARLYTMPPEPPPIVIAASAKRTARIAGEHGDGIIAFSGETLKEFDAAGGAGKPRYTQVKLCWAESEEEAQKTAWHYWPNAGMTGPLGTDLRLPGHFEQAAEMVTREAVAAQVPCGPDPEIHLRAIRSYVDAGFDHVCLHQIGPDQEGFIRFFKRELEPALAAVKATA